MKTISVVQLLRPNAEKRMVGAEVSDIVAEKWEKIRALGLRLTAEVIPGGPDIHDQVCVCIEHPVWGDFAMFLEDNYPDDKDKVIDELEKMILNFNEDQYRGWLEDLEDDDE
jgi:hypothetical protein